MDHEMPTRLSWVELYAQTGNAGLVRRRCGISCPTVRLWWRRYQADGLAGSTVAADAHIIHPTQALDHSWWPGSWPCASAAQVFDACKASCGCISLRCRSGSHGVLGLVW
jgi:Helix-turn-helix domain